MHYRFATLEDAATLAPLNHQLIRDEGHRNPMTVRELETRMRGWLSSEYSAVLAEQPGQPVAYALFKSEPDHIYLRQLFVVPESRRTGIGRELVAWLQQNAWPSGTKVRLDVLMGNVVGRSFWSSIGFTEYCVTMELSAQNDG